MTDAARRWALLAALTGVTAVWGLTFVMVKEAIAAYPLYAFLAVRFAIAAVAFGAMFPRTLRALSDRRLLAVGVLAGTLLTSGYVFQTVGLQYTKASVAAFITGLFVVLTPLMEYVFFRRPPGRASALGVALAVPGMWLLTGADVAAWGRGEWLLLLCAVAFAAHLVALAGPGRRHDPLALTLVQLAFTAGVCGAISLATERAPLPSSGQVWVALLVTGILASAVAFGVQTVALRYLSATRTALILVTEPVFGGIFGFLLAGEVLGAVGLSGAGLMLGGMVVSEAGRFVRRPHARLVVGIEGPAVPVADEAASRRRAGLEQARLGPPDTPPRETGDQDRGERRCGGERG
ncbi:MAG: DMT family transporter [Coriobacteriia bacterium]|nr:DMT family transporter [Coriobacteriia bacterium]